MILAIVIYKLFGAYFKVGSFFVARFLIISKIIEAKSKSDQYLLYCHQYLYFSTLLYWFFSSHCWFDSLFVKLIFKDLLLVLLSMTLLLDPCIIFSSFKVCLNCSKFLFHELNLLFMSKIQYLSAFFAHFFGTFTTA